MSKDILKYGMLLNMYIQLRFQIFVRINRDAELGVYFNIGSQWSVSREIVRIRA